MKMNIKSLFGGIMIALCLSSCNNFLDLVPEDQVSGASFFSNEGEFRQALNAAYNPLRTAGPDYVLGEMRSDNTHYEYNPGDRGTARVMMENVPDFQDDASNDYTKQIYNANYLGITRTNIVIDRIRANTTLSESVKSDIEGQARFLRAFYYFKLVRYFGGVPLYLHEISTAEDAFLGRSTAEEVYAQIIEDAKYAMDNLQPATQFPQSGLATKGAATILLADVYVTLKRYADAKPLLQSLTSMGYELLPEYSDVFATRNKNSRESIFEVQFMEDLQTGMSSNFIYIFLPRSTNTALVTGVSTNNSGSGGWNTPTTDLIESYEPNDKRLDASIGIAEGVYNASNHLNISAYKSIVDYQAAAGTVGVPFIKKYLNPHSNSSRTDDNWPVYRYAEALLLLAEVHNELGEGNLALPYLNQVRARAGLNVSPAAGQNEIRNAILQERRVELAFENKRWLDLVRTGKAVDVMKSYATRLKQEKPYLTSSSYQIEDFKLLYPIPRTEVDLNPGVMVQNPGYN